MKKLLGLLVILFIIGCDTSENEFLREGLTYYGTELKKSESFTGTVLKKENLLIYKYKSQKDTSKVITIRYDIRSKKLLSLTDKFIVDNRPSLNQQNFYNQEFDIYISENPSEDATSPIIFNREYGLIGIYNSFGPTIIFLKNKNDTINRNLIFQKLNE